MLQQLHALIIESDPDSRARLREVINSLAHKTRVESFRDFTQGKNKMEVGFAPQAIFISESLGLPATEKFLKDLVHYPTAKGTVTIYCLQSTRLEPSLVSKLFLAGITGFICQPFSPSEMLQLIESGKESVSRGRDAKRMEHQLASLFLNEAVQYVDDIADNLQKETGAAGVGVKKLRGLYDSLKPIATNQPDLYADLLHEKFQSVPVPTIRTHLAHKIKEKILHPGTILLATITKRDLSTTRFAEALKIDETWIKLFLAGKETLTSEAAASIARVIGETPRYWMQLQKKYDEKMAKVNKRKS